MEYLPTIGLEIHIELKTNSKMFCLCKNDPNEKKPNTNICPVCLAHPGTLPVINQKALELVIKTGLALKCTIEKNSWFERKNYFYPDLPKGYQISQYQAPLCKNGFLRINKQKIRIRRIHLEEDTGKLLHSKTGNYSLVDFNRAGVPLMELVTEPDIHSAKEARQFAKELQLILRYLGVSEANMEKGEMRVEVNISLSPKKSKKYGTKVEIKNLNSLRAIEKAIEYEIKRQSKILNRGEEVKQETRGWNDAKQITFSQRTKEQAHDYRYFPEPDLPPLNISQEFIDKMRTAIEELPQIKRKRFEENYGLNPQDLEFYIKNKKLANFFEEIIGELDKWLKDKKNLAKDRSFLIKLTSNYISNYEKPSSLLSIIPKNFLAFIRMIYNKEISSRIAKKLLDKMVQTGNHPLDIIQKEGLQMITDQSELQTIVEKVIKNNPQAIKDYKSGKKEAEHFLVGQVMAKTKGKADPQKIHQLLIQYLEN